MRSQNSPVSILDGIIAPVRPEMDEVERNIRSWTASPNPLIAEVGRYLFQDKGKRLRPAVLLLSSRVAGYRGSEAPFLAGLIEVIHTASLIHDDIIDNSALRRGKAVWSGVSRALNFNSPRSTTGSHASVFGAARVSLA